MAKNYLVTVSLLFLLCLACKKEMPLPSGFELSATTEGNKVFLNWSPVLLSGFKSINIYRSASPIPDPQFNKPIDATLLIGTISDRTIMTFRDSNVVLDHGGIVYYKIVLNLTDRIIPSNEEQLNFNDFSLTLGFKEGSYTTVLPERNLLYILNGSSGTISIIDYSQKKLIKTSSLPSQWGAPYAVMNAGDPDLFMNSTSTQISCYDGLTFATKYSITIPSGYIRDYKVRDNFMYILYIDNYVGRIRIYDLSNQMAVSDKVLYLTPGKAANLYVSTSNELFVKYFSQLYNSQGGYYVYKYVCVKYNLVNYLPADSIIISHPLLTSDSLNSNNYNCIQPSPDGNFLTCNQNGGVLDLSNNTIHSVVSTNSSSARVVYSQTGNYLIVKPANTNNAILPNLLDIYSLPGFNLVASTQSPNPVIVPGSASIFKDDFIDNDSLISYSLKSTSAGNQSVLTFYFKKLD